jgi:poly(beta-D-mannuronate) lyase
LRGKKSKKICGSEKKLVKANMPRRWDNEVSSMKVWKESSVKSVPANTKVTFNRRSVRQSTNYGNNSYPASNAWSNGSKFTHTNSGVGQWWEVKFNDEYLIGKVKILNRRDCCGGRLARTKVFVDNQVCGEVQNGTRNGTWYEVRCAKPLYGRRIRLVTQQRTYLSISGFEAYTAALPSA